MHKEHHTEAMAAEMRAIVSHAQALVEATAGEVDDKISKARANLQERLHTVQGSFGGWEGKFKDKADAADDLIRDKPYQVMGGTFLAGLLLGWFMTRK